jgi:hypothetical protein
MDRPRGKVDFGQQRANLYSEVGNLRRRETA